MFNNFNNDLVLEFISFDLKKWDLDYFKKKIFSFFKCYDKSYLGVTFYVHILDSNISLIKDPIVFEVNIDSLEESIEYLYNKISVKYLDSLAGNDLFNLYISKTPLSVLDFYIVSSNKTYKKS